MNEVGNYLIPKVFQLTFTCSKSTIETVKKGVQTMFKVNNKNTRMKSMMTSFWCFYC